MTAVQEIEKTEDIIAEQPKPAGQATLGPSAMQIADHLRTRWAAVVTEACTIDDILRPSFWQHVCAKLSMFDAVEVIPESRGWFADLRVIDTGVGYAKLVLVNHITVDADTDPNFTEYTTTVEWKGPQKKYCVIRMSDGVILRDGFARKNDAKRAQIDLEMVFAR